ncbi:Bgt-4381 [Blumeria graminis f. sp. tritici]|uniref:Bgt-4381 n=2 Tax=Blumeria graminis f. sp. tritici TaxID=62690 RepID=A0A381L9L1_BLUGR|nr:hypothetical protein BGT96224_4381 [Blumeria graminis f. sp. tritici 96224]VDB83728.1 Bgt-4381 [Blumeria graminis f. sp. tritici]
MMLKKTSFTTITPLPSRVTRQIVLETLHSHTEMINLNPLVEEHRLIKPPPNATAEEYHCLWYALTDRVQYLPGGLMSGKVSYNVCFHDLVNGLQAHSYAPMGLNVKNKWTLCGSLPGEPIAPVEIGVGAPLSGLYIREDVIMQCNFMTTSFVKRAIKKAHGVLINRLVAKAQFSDSSLARINTGLPVTSPSDYEPMEFGRDGQNTSDESTSQDAYTSLHSQSKLRPVQPTITYHDTDSNSLSARIPHRYSPTSSWSGSVHSTRASHSCSPATPRSLWQNLNPPGLNNDMVILEPGSQNICFELDAPESLSLEKAANHNSNFMREKTTETGCYTGGKETQIIQQNSFGPVELEGSMPT